MAECEMCGRSNATHDAGELGELLMGQDEFMVCTDCLNKIEAAVKKAWREGSQS